MLVEAKDTFAHKQQLALIERAKAGDVAAFQSLYGEHHARVYSLCLRLTADKSYAEDATQEVFVQLWRKLSNFQGQAKFTTWLHSVTSNVAISYLRKQKGWLKNALSFEQAGLDEAHISDLLGSSELKEHGLDALILRLPERARQVFVLHAMEGYRHEEIANLLNIAVGSSKSQYHRARNLLKEWYDNE